MKHNISYRTLETVCLRAVANRLRMVVCNDYSVYDSDIGIRMADMVGGDGYMQGDTLRFAIRRSVLVWITSVGVITGVAVATAVLVRAVVRRPPEDVAVRALLILAACLPGAVLGVVALFAPRGYGVRADGIVISRLARDLVIRRDQVREVRRISAGEIGFAWRTLGSGGFLGWFGWFHSRALGGFLAYAGNRDDLVLIVRRDGEKIVISPDRPDAFVEAVRSRPQQPD